MKISSFFIKSVSISCLLVLFLFFPSLSSYSGASQQRSFLFAGHEWSVFDSEWTKVNPGNNYFSAQNISTDSEGKLHLKVRYDMSLGAWTCAQITSIPDALYGTYTFTIDTNLERLDQNIVLGIFLYRSDRDARNKKAEVDLEFSKWGFPKKNQQGEWIDLPHNSWYVLWPQWEEGQEPKPQKTEGFWLSMKDYETSEHQIQWEDCYLAFRSYIYDPVIYRNGEEGSYPYYEAEYLQKKLRDPEIYIPSEQDHMKLIMNLWIIDGQTEPYDGEEIEIVLDYSYREPGQ